MRVISAGSGGWLSREPSIWPTITRFSCDRHRRYQSGRGRVPEKFLMVQWLRLPGGQRLQPSRRFAADWSRRPGHGPGPQLQKGPEPTAGTSHQRSYANIRNSAGRGGQKIRFWLTWRLGVSVGLDILQSIPKWVRTLVYVWLFIALLSRACSSPEDRSAEGHSEKSPPLRQEAQRDFGQLPGQLQQGRHCETGHANRRGIFRRRRRCKPNGAEPDTRDTVQCASDDPR